MSSRTLFSFVLLAAASASCSDGPALLGPGTDAGHDAALLDAMTSDAALDMAFADFGADFGADLGPELEMDASVDAGLLDGGFDASATDAELGDAGDPDASIGDDSCFWPTRFRDHTITPWLVYIDATPITTAATLSSEAQAQVVVAVQQSAHTDVSTAEEALTRVEDVLLTRFWDDSNQKALDVYTYYAGDNLYGAAFEAGLSSVLAAIHDGDVTGCTRARGSFRRACASSTECASEDYCAGIIGGVGKCVPREAVLGSGAECSSSADCATDFGVVCAEAIGICYPAWMQTVVPTTIGSLSAGGEETRTMTVSGIATVDVGVTLGVYAPSHPRPTDLWFEVLNPSGSMSMVSVTDSAQVLGRIDQELRLHYSGDESVNGTWTIRVHDDGSGEGGDIDRVWLRVKSRLD